MASAKTETEDDKKPTVTKEQVKAHITKFIAARDIVRKAEEGLAKAKEKQNTIVKEIHDYSGPGKYRVGDEVLTLTARKGKKSDKVSYFFKGASEEEVMGD